METGAWLGRCGGWSGAGVSLMVCFCGFWELGLGFGLVLGFGRSAQYPECVVFGVLVFPSQFAVTHHILQNQYAAIVISILHSACVLARLDEDRFVVLRGRGDVRICGCANCCKWWDRLDLLN